MFDITNAPGQSLNFDERNDHAMETYSQEPGSTKLSVTSAGDTCESSELMADALDFTRVKLMSFSLLNSAQEHDLAMSLSKANRAIAERILSWDRSARELLNLLNTAISHSLDNSHFLSREHYFELRTELAHFTGKDNNAVAVLSLVDVLHKNMPLTVFDGTLSPIVTKYISAVDWPGPLMLALAQRHSNYCVPSSRLALAIDEHLRHCQVNSDHGQPTKKLANQLHNYASDYIKAREGLVNHNLRLVFYVAKRYTDKREHMADLIQDGILGLIRAAEKFRPAKGYRFSTYAYQWIESKIRKAQVNIDRTISISPEYNGDLIRLSQWTEQQKCDERHWTTNDLLKELNINEERLNTLIGIKPHPLSIDTHRVDEGLSLHEKLITPHSNFAESIAKENGTHYLRSIMQAALTKREYYVVSERFGYLDSDAKTL